ncbi:MAG TPA: filamentous hemagglutinin N-terminal domain-containing protein, partial [Chloroflexota bacterium]|nr:filamentous hemagglutinin N-terminal domain-containing protein [Chloroflexota bacterium]
MLSVRRFVRQTLLLACMGAALSPQLSRADGLPTGGRYVAGAGSIATTGATTTITQASQRGIIDWQSFSIAAGKGVQFNNANGATLNRVTGGDLSRLFGELKATGSVYLINPNGVVVGPSGKILTGGSFVGSTRDVSNDQFMRGGALAFSGRSTGSVVNEGKIVSRDGDVVLIGASSRNKGVINAPNGTAALAAGDAVVMREASGPDGITVAPGVGKGDVTTEGTIQAAAVALSSAGGNVYALAGNRDGVIQATGTTRINGQVWLSAPKGQTTVTGDVAAANADGSGGVIVAAGREVAISGTARLSASGTRGGSVLAGVTGDPGD